MMNTSLAGQSLISILADDIPLIVTPANAEAWRVICQWRTWPDGCMALTGPRASGKSTMTTAWSSHTNARYINGQELADMSVADIHALADRALAVDDAHAAGGTLLAIFNLCGRFPLLLTGVTPPSTWPMLSRDLQSRLDAVPVTRIALPCDATMHTLLIAACRKHLVRLPRATCQYLVSRMPRCYDAIALVAETMALSETSASLATARAALGRVCDERTHV